MNTDLLVKIIELLSKSDHESGNKIDNEMIGKYVIVRCRDAGVHCGYLESYNGRECLLKNSRRLWYWKPKNNAKWLSGLATVGIDEESKVSCAVDKIHLTENCEIILCTTSAAQSLINIKASTG